MTVTRNDVNVWEHRVAMTENNLHECSRGLKTRTRLDAMIASFICRLLRFVGDAVGGGRQPYHLDWNGVSLVLNVEERGLDLSGQLM